MTQDTKIQKQIWSLFDSLRGSVGYYNFFSSVVHLIFLKYLISYGDRFELFGVESFRATAAFKRKYDNARSGGEPLNYSDIRDLFVALDSEHVFGDVRLSDFLNGYSLLFEDYRNQRMIIRTLEEVEIDYSKDFLGSFFEYLIQQCARDVRMTGESVTNKSLRQLAVKIMDIKHSDTVLNCFSGFSTFMFNMKEYGSYYGFEINPDSYVISKMLMTMLGVPSYNIYNQDFLMSDTHQLADKVFSDGPLNMRYDNFMFMDAPWANNLKTRDGNLLILYKVLDSIKDNGTAVIAVPGKVLFSNHQSYTDLRKTYVDAGLKAVISLPPLWSGTIINTNLLVVEKGYKGPIKFIDAQKLGVSDKQRNYVLLEKDIDKILDALKEEKDVDGFSKLVNPETVKEIDAWQPNRFVEVKTQQRFKDIKDIDAELDSLYEELKNNLK